MYQILKRILQSAKAYYAALNLHCCRDTCHITLGGKGNAWLEVFRLCEQFMRVFFVRVVAAEAVG